MSAELEKYLITRRENLDVETPDDASIWKGIRGKLQSQPAPSKESKLKINLIRIMNIAAAAIILFSLGYIVNDIINAGSTGRSITLSTIDSELGRREKEYQTLVLLKTGEVSSLTGSGNLVVRQLFEEIKQLDTVYDQAMSDLKELGPNEKLVNTIFRIYEQKIRLLELIILESNKINSHENIEKIIL